MVKIYAIFYIIFKYLLKRKPKTREEIDAFHDKEVINFLKKNLKKSKYYSSLYKNLDIKNWRNFPIIAKKEFMENFDDLNTCGIKKEEAYNLAIEAERTRDFAPTINNITIGLSSGTSGNRGVFLVSEIERYLWAICVLNKILPSSIFKKQRIAFFLRANSNLYESLKLFNVEFKFFDLINPIEKNISDLDSYKPTIIISPPSMLRMIAKEQQKNRINIQPQKLISVAEVLEEIDRIYIEKIFKQKLHQGYQATEGFIATTCEYGTLHINEDIMVVQKEYIDKENNRFVPIITDFSRITQPIIRYRLNDILTEKTTPCPCGSSHIAIERIEGRCDDIFYFTDKNGVEKLVFPDFLSRAIIYVSENIEEYKIEQRENEIKVFLKLSNNCEEKEIKELVKNEINSILQRQNIEPQIITFEEYQRKTSLQKMKRIERKIKK